MATFGFGSTAAAPSFGTAFSFGAPTSTTSTPSFASSFAFNPPTNVSGSGFNFGSTPATSAQSLFGTTPAFGLTTTSSSIFPTFGQTATMSAPSSGFNFGGAGNLNMTGFGGTMSVASIPASTATTSVGLGGVNLQATTVDGMETSARKDKAVKETFIPNELVASVDAFKKYIKEQKAIREEMSRWSNKSILKIQSQVSSLKQQLSVVSNGLQRNAMSISKLKQESSEELRNAEIIQRTKDTPLALQYENTAPSLYFYNLAVSFENQMQSYRQQIEQLERHLVSLSQPSTMTPDELTMFMRRLHDTFVTLAAQLQTVHQQVQMQKEQFLALKKVNDGDMLNLFHSQKALTNSTLTNNNNNSSSSILSRAALVGPSPLMAGSSDISAVIMGVRRQELQACSVNFGATGGANTTGLHTNMTSGMPSFGGNSSFGGGNFGFSSDSSGQSPFALNNQKPFQLQKPPSGNKRGKRWTST